MKAKSALSEGKQEGSSDLWGYLTVTAQPVLLVEELPLPDAGERELVGA